MLAAVPGLSRSALAWPSLAPSEVGWFSAGQALPDNPKPTTDRGRGRGRAPGRPRLASASKQHPEPAPSVAHRPPSARLEVLRPVPAPSPPVPAPWSTRGLPETWLSGLGPWAQCQPSAPAPCLSVLLSVCPSLPISRAAEAAHLEFLCGHCT